MRGLRRFFCDDDELEFGVRKIKSARLSEISLVHDGVHCNTLDYRSAKPKNKKRIWTDLL